MQTTYLSRVLLLITLITSVGAWSADGRILDFEGDVRVNGEQVTAETELNSEDTLVTGPGASVKIVLSDNSILDLDGGTAIKISDYYFNAAEPEENTSNVDILAGTLRYVSGRIAKEDPENISFTAGNSTIGVRGTFISISVSPPGE